MTDGSPTNPGSHGPRWEIQPTPLGTEPDVDPADPLGLGDLDGEAGASDPSEHTHYNQAHQGAQQQSHQQGPVPGQQEGWAPQQGQQQSQQSWGPPGAPGGSPAPAQGGQFGQQPGQASPQQHAPVTQSGPQQGQPQDQPQGQPQGQHQAAQYQQGQQQTGQQQPAQYQQSPYSQGQQQQQGQHFAAQGPGQPAYGQGQQHPAQAHSDQSLAGQSLSGQPHSQLGVPERVPTAQDFLLNRHQSMDVGPATWGWRGFLRKASFGLIKLQMGKAERSWRESRAAVQRSFDGPRTIVFANPKGGAAKTTSVLAAGYTFGTVRGGGVVAWDNNETRGTLGIRGERANHQNTTRELLDDLEKFQDVYESRIGDLGAFVRSQGDAHFDVLASDERADVTGTIKADDFGAVHRLLERFYHLILVDTGNNLRAENWLAAAQTADLIVVTCTVREDTGYSGLWMLDALADAGHQHIREKTVTVLADPSEKVDAQLAKDLVEVYSKRTSAVFRIPYDPALVAGSVIQYGQLSEKTRNAWLEACAAMAQRL